ncbi:hypothetical protein ABCR94_34410 [Streptomyces sp. 21So2-11]
MSEDTVEGAAVSGQGVAAGGESVVEGLADLVAQRGEDGPVLV